MPVFSVMILPGPPDVQITMAGGITYEEFNFMLGILNLDIRQFFLEAQIENQLDTNLAYNRKIKNATSSHQKGRLSREKREYETFIAPYLADLTERLETRKTSPSAPPRGRRIQATKAVQPAVSWVNQVRDIVSKYETPPPRNLGQALKGIQKEISQAQGPIHVYNRKIKNARTRYQKNKLTREKREYEAFIAPYLADLVERRDDYKILQKGRLAIHAQERKTRNELKKLEAQLKKAKRSKDVESRERLTYQIIKLKGILDSMAGALGAEIKKTETEDYEPSEEEDTKGYEEDPNNPYTIWQAIRQLEEDQRSGEWKYFVIDGERYSAANVISIAVAASEFWLSLKKRNTDTPRVNRYFNFKKKTVKYTGFHS